MSFEDDDDDCRPWLLTVLRAQGLAYMNVGKKTWRPIVTVEVGEGHHAGFHETVLGVDGQNINIKLPFYLRGVDVGSKIDFKVWQRPETKRKTSRKNLVASSSHRLCDLLRKQEHEKVCEIRLVCQTQSKKRNPSSRGRPQNGASLVLKICPPSTFVSSCELGDEDEIPAPDSPTGTSTSSSSWPEEDHSLLEEALQEPRKVRRRRGFKVFSDDESCEEETDEEQDCEHDATTSKDTFDYDGDTFCNDEVSIAEPDIIDIIRTTPTTWEWMAASLLPQNRPIAMASSCTQVIEDTPRRSDTIDGASIRSNLSIAQRSVASFTVYHELREAQVDSEFEAIFRRLQTEWTYIGGLLVALSAVDAAVFAISPGTVFNVDGWAKLAVAASSIASGVGIAVDAWFLLRYNFTDLQTFIMRARDVFDSYFFFSISARLPAIAMFISALSLMSFLAIVAFEAWPNGVLVISCLFGIAVSLQFLAFGIHRLARGFSWTVKTFVDLIRPSVYVAQGSASA